MTKYPDDFMGWVELHEHSWGLDRYPNRPTLKEILASPVVTFWRPAKKDKDFRYHVRLFSDLKEIERYYTKLVIRANIEPPHDKLQRLFVHRKHYVISGVRMEFREVQD